MFANITTYHEWKDRSCVIEAGEHSYVTKKSLINFADARSCEAEKIDGALEQNIFKPHVKASDDLIKKIQEAFLKSSYTKPEDQKLVQLSMLDKSECGI